MPLARILYKKISRLAFIAAQANKYVLHSRNVEDDSYGSNNDEALRITLSLAALQCHAKKGLSLDSPRLSGTYDWLVSRSIKNPNVMIAPLRLAAAAIVRAEQNSVVHDIEATYRNLSKLNSSNQIQKPILYILSIEALSVYGKTIETDSVLKRAVERLSLILESKTERHSIRSYAATLLFTLGDDSLKHLAKQCWIELVDSRSNNGSWADCIVETSYSLLNALKIKNEMPEVKEMIPDATEFLCNSCPHGIPNANYIKHTPQELGTFEKDRKIYAASVLTQALVGVLGESEERACLEFGHASWKLDWEDFDNKIETLQKEKEKNENRFHKQLRWFQISTIILFLLFFLIVFINPGPIERIIAIIGSITGIISFIKGYFK